MSRDTWNLDHGPLRGLYRDRENGWIFGVCAGIADYFNFRTGTVRVIAAVCLCVFTLLTAFIYIVVTFLIREKPLIYRGRQEEFEFWRRRDYRGRWSH